MLLLCPELVGIIVMNTKFRGYLCGIIAAVCYGTNPLGAKFLYMDGINTDTVLFHRFSLAAVIIAIIMMTRNISFKLTKKEIKVLLPLGVLFVISSLTLYYSFIYMDAGVASTLLFVYPMMVAIIMALFFKEKLTVATVFSIVMAFAGIALLNESEGDSPQSTIGFILVMLSSLSYAIYIVVVNKTEVRMPSIKMTFYVLIVGAFVIFLHSMFDKETHLQVLTTAKEWMFALMLAVLPTILSLVFMNVSIRDVGSTPAAIMGALEPLTAVVIGIAVFHEVFTLRLGLGIILILSGVLLVVAGKAIPTNRFIHHIKRRSVK